MSVVNEFTINNSNLIEIPYSTIRRAIEVTESDPFPMTIRCPMEWAAIAQCVNQEIDAHLEACNIVGVDRYDSMTGECLLSANSLCVLLRRLGDTDFNSHGDFDAEDIWDAATSLQSAILTVLGIDEYGDFVGREALGLD